MTLVRVALVVAVLAALLASAVLLLPRRHALIPAAPCAPASGPIVWGNANLDVTTVLKAVKSVRAGGCAGMRIADVGANIGAWDMLAKQVPLVCQDAPFEAWFFEPSPGTFNLLNQSLGKDQRMHAVNLGVGAKDGLLPFFGYPDPKSQIGRFHGRGAASKRAGAKPTAQIPVRALDSLFADGVLDVLKVDVEGFEGQVFEGAARLLGARSPVVVYECHGW